MTLLTEEEAKAKWCPYSRAIFGESEGSMAAAIKNVASFNRWADVSGAAPTNPPACRCIASACMAWRFVGTNINDGKGGMEWSTITYGYCGAFGEAKHMPVSAPPDTWTQERGK